MIISIAGARMLLYFDVFITDVPLYKSVHLNEQVRKANSIFSMPDKLSITMYTLASYAVLPWSNVIIKYSIQDASKSEYFEKFVKSIFPNAIIVRGRSDNQKKFKESLELIKKLREEWIFYCGNNDHPFVGSEIQTLQACLEKAKEYKKTYKYVSIYYSHLPLLRSTTNKDSYFYGKQIRTLEENEQCRVILKPSGWYDAIQIVHVDLFEHWFCSKDFGSRRIIRSEDVSSPDPIEGGQIAVIPMRDVCDHFDGNSNIVFTENEETDDILPPLFIPPGFFENKIKIAFGYSDYRNGWVNINPTKKDYSFKDPVNGTDMKILLSDIPLFWKDRIESIDTNPNADQNAILSAYNNELIKKANPWPKKKNIANLKIKFKLYSYLFKISKIHPGFKKNWLESGSLPRRLVKRGIYGGFSFLHFVRILRDDP